MSKHIIDIISAGLQGDVAKVELASLSFSRQIKKVDKDLSQKIDDALQMFSFAGSDGLRRAGGPPLPVDGDTQLEMATIFKPNDLDLRIPVLNPDTKDSIQGFLFERSNIIKLLGKGISPSNSLIFTGPPGTGKTITAHYIATTLKKNLVILDLSSSMSSLLGKSGHNLKKVLQYAKQTGSVLLLDEFDAIAKRRDDTTDLGEIKRIVNVLLMEMENWPPSSVLIATTNHPELLDRAIWRRFDHSINFNFPDQDSRLLIINSELKEFINSGDEKYLTPISFLLSEKSAADVCKYCNNVKRRIVLKEESLIMSCLYELEKNDLDKKTKGLFCILAKKHLGKDITLKRLAELTGLSIAGVQHHITKKIISHEKK